MTNTLNVSGSRIKHQINKVCAIQGITREEFVVSCQRLLKVDGISFSLTGLDKMCVGNLPRKNPEKILQVVATVCGVSASEFTDPEAKSA